MVKILGIVPARGGSKRLPGKNIRLMNGKPLIAWTIEAAKDSKLLDKVVVSTDDRVIAQIALDYGAEVPFLRPAELATDNALTYDVVSHLLKFLKETEKYVPDYICLLQPTSPLRNQQHVKEAIRLLLSKKADACVSVSKTKLNPYLTNLIDKNDRFKFLFKDALNNNHKRPYSDYYLLNGAIYLIRTEVFQKKKTFEPENTVAYVMPDEKSVDIDSLIEFDLAEFLMKRFNEKTGSEKKPNEIKIGKRVIGEGHPCFIIAEAGVNHNGDIKIAKQLIDAAKNAGVDAIKFQTFKAENLVTINASQAAYQSKNVGKTESQFTMLKRLELDYKEFFELKNYCDKKNILFLTTPHSSKEDVDLVAKLCPLIKVGSGDLTNTPILEYMAQKKLPIILSTGMSNIEEVADAVNAVAPMNNHIVLLHCTTNYPTPLSEVNLRAMHTLRMKFGYPIGYSDHTRGIEVSVLAAAMGACVIEKHFTLDHNLPGPDHKASLESKDLTLLVKTIRDNEKKSTIQIGNNTESNVKSLITKYSLADALGDGKKVPMPSEFETMKVARKSLVAASDIKKGSIITDSMIQIKRPGDGLQPKYYGKVLGKKALRNIQKDELFRLSDFSK